MVTSVTTEQGRNKAVAAASYTITDTRMQVRLTEAIKPGESIKVRVVYSFKIPRYGSDRMGTC